MKFDSAGNLLWELTWGGSMNDYGQGIAVDSLGGVYVTGTTFSFVSSDYSNVVVMKLRSNGSLVWQESWGYQLYNYGSGVALDSSENLYISGYTSDNPYGSNNAVLLKLNSTGALVWQEEWSIFSNPGFPRYNINTLSSAVTVESNGTLYTTGFSDYNVNGLSYLGVPIIKFNSDGSLVWQKIWIRSTPSYYSPDQNGYAIAIDSTGNIYIAGQSLAYGQGTSPSGVLLLEFSTRGDLEWEATTATSSSDAGKGIGVATSGDPILVGNLYEAPPSSLTGLNDPALNGNFTLQAINGQQTATNATRSPLSAINTSPSGSLAYSGNNDAYMVKLQPPQPSPPSPPLALVAQAGLGNISLSWAPPQYTGGHPITAYNIYRGPNAGGETLLASTSAVKYVDTNIKNGPTYYYYVKAVNSLGESDASNENYATIGATVGATIPFDPTILGGASVLVVAVVGLVVYQRRKRVLHFG